MEQNSIFVTKEAYLSLNQLFNYYEDKSTGLGVMLLDVIEEKLSSLSKFPIRSKLNEQLMFLPLGKFPINIIYSYLLESKEVVIIDYFHTSQNPINN